MASSDVAMDGPMTSSGIRIRSKEDLNRVIAQVKRREEALKVAMKKLKIRETRLDEAEMKLKKRNEFLDAWEVSLKNKEAETMEERQELENLKKNLRRIGQDLLALSDKTESVFEGVPYEDDIFEDLHIEEPPEEKKSFLGFLKGGSKKTKSEPSEDETFGKPNDEIKKVTLRETLEAKRDKLKSATVDSIPMVVEEGTSEYICPNCGEEVSKGEVLCLGCDTELVWD
jgi:predicted RNA-binding Zn-ribbon protein involved in translation (DUF1610 family)